MFPATSRVIFDEKKKERNSCESSTSGAFQKLFLRPYDSNVLYIIQMDRLKPSGEIPQEEKCISRVKEKVTCDALRWEKESATIASAPTA